MTITPTSTAINETLNTSSIYANSLYSVNGLTTWDSGQSANTSYVNYIYQTGAIMGILVRNINLTTPTATQLQFLLFDAAKAQQELVGRLGIKDISDALGHRLAMWAHATESQALARRGITHVLPRASTGAGVHAQTPGAKTTRHSTNTADTRGVRSDSQTLGNRQSA